MRNWEDGLRHPHFGFAKMVRRFLIDSQVINNKQRAAYVHNYCHIGSKKQDTKSNKQLVDDICQLTVGY